ncbi:MAG: hypothetical protein ABJA50_09310 [Chloroflexota bacterium]
MSRILWNQVEAIYRAQANSGDVITVDEDAMQRALVNAGNAVFDTEWWVEAMPSVLEHWSLGSRRWMDQVTGMPRVHYRLLAEVPVADGTGPFGSNAGHIKGTGPLTTRLLNSGKLESSKLDSGKLDPGGADSGRLRELNG